MNSFRLTKITTPVQQTPPQRTQWFVIKTKKNAEKRVQERQEAIGFTTFSHLYQTIRQWSERKKTIKAPLIPSHQFMYCSPNELRSVYASQGIVSVLSEFGNPTEVIHKYRLKIATDFPQQKKLIQWYWVYRIRSF